jgi:ectoine hydroxylase-related dioxygenase (phytanoyl-CoA dioxygenase family)
MLPEIDLNGQTPVNDISQSDLLMKGAEWFLKHGVLLVRHVFSPDFIRCLHEEYKTRYKRYLVDESDRNLQDFHDAKGVGVGRIMIPLELAGSFNSEEFYANCGLMPLLEYLLGKSLIINSLGSVFSLPGSPDQHVHRDMANIYATDVNRNIDDSWLASTPPYAITMGTPLIPITTRTGNTRFWPGTHISTIRHDDPALGQGVDFTCSIGSCILFDYRVLHAGVANRSELVRPLLYTVYSRDWFRDSVNYDKHSSLEISAAQFTQIPDRYQHLFSWAVKDTDRRSSPRAQKPGRNDLCYCNSGRKYKHCHGKLA